MRKILFAILVVLLSGMVFAISCQTTQGVIAGTDCNFFVFKGSTATPTDLNLWDTNSQQILVNAHMFDVNGLFATYKFKTSGTPTEYMFRIMTTTPTTTICGGGYFKTVDLNVDSRVKDANNTSGKSWLDLNSSIKVIDANLGKIDLDLNANINSTHTDLNNAIKTIDANLVKEWFDLNSSVTVSNWNASIGMRDLNNNIKQLDLNISARLMDINGTLKDTNKTVQRMWTDVNGGIIGLMAGQVTITGNQATLSAKITDVNTRVVDSNTVEMDILYDINRFMPDLNAGGGSGGATAAQVWGYSPRTLTDYNQGLSLTYAGDTNTIVGTLSATGLTATVDANAIARAVWDTNFGKQEVGKLLRAKDILVIIYEILTGS